MEELEVNPSRDPEGAEEPEHVEEVIAEEFVVEAPAGPDEDAQLKAIIEAAIYITDEPLTPAQIAAALTQPAERINRLLDELTAEYNRPERGLSIRGRRELGCSNWSHFDLAARRHPPLLDGQQVHTLSD